MKSKASPLSLVIKDLEITLRNYKNCLKAGENESAVHNSQIAFLKVAKTSMLLLNGSPETPEIKTLKKQANSLISHYKSICARNKAPDMPTEILACSFEEDKEVYNNPEELNTKLAQIRSQEIESLHKEMLKLNEIFRDVSGYVKEQGEMLEEIKVEVEIAERTTERTNVELSKAKILYNEAKRKCCWIILIFVIVLSAIGGIIAGVIISG